MDSLAFEQTLSRATMPHPFCDLHSPWPTDMVFDKRVCCPRTIECLSRPHKTYSWAKVVQRYHCSWIVKYRMSIIGNQRRSLFKYSGTVAYQQLPQMPADVYASIKDINPCLNESQKSGVVHNQRDDVPNSKRNFIPSPGREAQPTKYSSEALAMTSFMKPTAEASFAPQADPWQPQIGFKLSRYVGIRHVGSHLNSSVLQITSFVSKSAGRNICTDYRGSPLSIRRDSHAMRLFLILFWKSNSPSVRGDPCRSRSTI